MKVYVSSTSEDLADYRQTVIAKLRLSGHMPVCMEDVPAINKSPKDRCMEDVAGCDVYVGIFAWRYGYIPLGHEISITEMEYREAKDRIPTLIFLLKEDVQWPEKFCDKCDEGRKIKKLRDELQQNKWVRFFTNPDNLTSEVLAAIIRLELEAATRLSPEERERQKKEMNHLREDYDKEKGERKKTHRKIIIPEKPIRYFQDRDVELSELRKCLLNKNLRMISICGRGGVGKTSLALKFIRELENNREASRSGYNNIENISYVDLKETENQAVSRILEKICEDLNDSDATELKEIWNQKSVSETDRLAEIFKGPLSRFRYLILLDNLESVLDNRNQIKANCPGLKNFIDAFFEYDHAGLLIVTTRSILSLSQDAEIAAIGRRIQISLDEGLPESFALALLCELDDDNQLGISSVPKEKLNELVSRCQGIPRTLETFVATLRGSAVWTLDNIFADDLFFDKFVKNPSRELYVNLSSDQERLVMQVLSVYDKPVPIAAIRYMLPALPIDEILENFFHNFIANCARGQFWLHPLDRFYAYSQIPDQGETHSKPAFHKLAAQFYRKLRKPKDSWKSFDDIEPQLNEFHHLMQSGLFDDACLILNDNELDREYLSIWGYSQEIIKMRSQMLDRINDRKVACLNLGHLGSAYLDSGDNLKAKGYYESALTLAREINNEGLICRWLGNLGLAFSNLGDYKKGAELLSSALKLATSTNDKLHENRWLGNLTWTLLAMSQISEQEAIQNYLKAIIIAHDIKDRRFEMIWSERVARLYIRIGDLDKAKEQFIHAINEATRIGAKTLTCHIQLKLGEIFGLLAETDKQIEFYDLACKGLGDIDSPADKADVLIKLAAIYSSQGQRQKQLECYDKALQIVRQLENKSAELRLLFILGDESDKMGERDKAKKYYDMARHNARDANDYADEINAILRLAWIADRSGEENEGAQNYEKALQVAHEAGNPSDEAIVASAYANALLNRGNAMEASKYYEMALPIVEDMNDKASQSNICNRLGMAAILLKDVNKAIGYYEQCLKIAGEVEDRDSESVALFNIGDAYHFAGDVEKAIPYYKKALAVNMLSTNFKSALGIGIAYLQMGQVQEGNIYLNKCIDIIQAVPNSARLFHPHLTALAASLIAVGKSAEGLEVYRSGLKLYPAKEHLYYAIQDLELLQRLTEPIAGVIEAINIIKRALSAGVT